jgi:hypothetical protein
MMFFNDRGRGDTNIDIIIEKEKTIEKKILDGC